MSKLLDNDRFNIALVYANINGISANAIGISVMTK